jgi:branched-chain amino acid transport system ATP-binding protein
MLRLKNLNKSYGNLKVIDNLSLDVSKGEMLGIIGPNGAGKTTLFSAISGQISVDSGQIDFMGKNITKLPAYKRCIAGIGRSFQIPRPFHGMTIFENVRVAANFGGALKGAVADEFAINAVELSGLIDRLNTPCSVLSLLDRKRLELARSLATNPKLLLLDEIAGGLIEHEIHELIEILEVIRQREISIIWIEHIVHALTSCVDRLLVINFGSKIADGNPNEVIALPQVHEIYMGLDVDDNAARN